jgi:hypothetical protein
MATTDSPRVEPVAPLESASLVDAARHTRPSADSTASPLARGTRLAVEASLRRQRLATTRSR